MKRIVLPTVDIEYIHRVPEKHFLAAVLDRALRDLQEKNPVFRRAAIQWFTQDINLLPDAVSYRDCLDNLDLTSDRLKEINRLIRITLSQF